MNGYGAPAAGAAATMSRIAKVYLLDIEGTTTPIDFVHRTLFGFASRELPHYFNANQDCKELREQLQGLRKEYETDLANGVVQELWHNERTVIDALAYLQFLIRVDRKSPPLKWIQGKIWQEGYVSGELKGEVFADVPMALQRWKESGASVAIYSSGSVLAQKLLFGYSTAGDLTEYIDHYFDTAVGGKRDSQSYKKIAETLNVSPLDVLFVSDVPEELVAAQEAGLQIALAVRPGNAVVHGDFRRVESFDEFCSGGS